jgi:hypothetical protein
LATGLSTAITKDGQTTTTARIPFAAGISSTLTTDSSSVSTGSIITAGGVGVAKALYVGTTANVAGAVTLQSALSVTGVTTVQAGTAAAPAITTTGDTNTGIFFPAADTIAFSTSGTEDARFDSAGNFGLGVTPSAWGSSYKSLEGSFGQSWYYNNAATLTGITSNTYNNGTNWIYKTTNPALRHELGATGDFRWFNAASGTAGNTISFAQAMTLDASGNLLVGYTSSGGVRGVFSNGANGLPATSGTTQTYGALRVRGGNNAVIDFGCNSTDTWIQATDLGGLGNGYNLLLNPNGGNLLVGTTTALGSERLSVLRTVDTGDYVAVFKTTTATATNNYGLQVVLNGDPNDATRTSLNCKGLATTRAEIRSNGGIANYSANNVNLSDRREKTNFAPATSYLDKICAIPVQTFNYIDQNLEEDAGLTLGVVAQDVQAVAPELVMESNWAGKDEEPKMRLSIYQTDLQYALMKSIQELKAIVDAQAVEIAALKGTA